MRGRRLSWFLRPFPDAIVIGAMKAGTSSCLYYLVQHPDVRPPMRKETHYLDSNHHRGDRWYRAHFDASLGTREWITAESTPPYLSYPPAPQRLKLIAPHAKLVVLLRDPVYRAASQWRHRNRVGRDPRTFTEVIAAEESYDPATEASFDESPDALVTFRERVLSHGLYAVHLRRWFEHFEKEQLLIVDSADLFADESRTMAEIYAFLGLSSWEVPDTTVMNAGDDRSTEPTDVARLATYYRPHNEDLFDLLGRRFDWL